MVSSDTPQENYSQALRLLESKAVAPDCELLVFPENFLHFGLDLASYKAQDLDAYLEAFKELAKQRSMNLVLGSVPVPAHDSRNRHYSRSLLINSQGQVQAYYDKQHLFDVKVGDEHGQYRESDSICPGRERVVTALKLKDGSIAGLGFSICYDLRFADQFISLRHQGAKIIVVPSAFTEKTGKAHWEVLLRARAIETQCYILAANQGGLHSAKRKTWGHSMIIDPWGRILSECGKGQALCCADLDLHLLDTIRADMPLYGLE